MRSLFVLPLMLTACDLTELTGGLTEHPHPCFGNRTDTLHIDDASTMYVGCGSTTEGQGLYRTTDAGFTWEEVDGFEGFRVSHVHRGSDGVLYVAGTGPNSQRVLALADDGSTTRVLEAAQQTWNSFQVGTFLVLDDGSAIAESLTGSDIAFRPSETAEWQDGSGWWQGEQAFQILDAVVHDGHVAAVGSTISQPPMAFLQDPTAEGLSMQEFTLLDTDGELWSIDSDGTGLIAGGVDQIADVGLIFWADGTPSSADDWNVTDLRDLFDEPSWVRGVCRDGGHLVAVGELSMRAEGILVESLDGGATWRDATPLDAPPLSGCDFAEGRFVVVGAEGYFAIE